VSRRYDCCVLDPILVSTSYEVKVRSLTALRSSRDRRVGGALRSREGDWYGEVSPDGREHWPVVMAGLYVAHPTEPALTPRDLARVTCPTLVMQGDRDEMPVERSATLFRALADAHLAVVPAASHGLLVERPSCATRSSARFCANRPTFAAGAGSLPSIPQPTPEEGSCLVPATLAAGS